MFGIIGLVGKISGVLWGVVRAVPQVKNLLGGENGLVSKMNKAQKKKLSKYALWFLVAVAAWEFIGRGMLIPLFCPELLPMLPPSLLPMALEFALETAGG